MTGAYWPSTIRVALPAPSNRDGGASGLPGRRLAERDVMTLSQGRLGGGPPCFCLNRHGWNRVRLLGWIGSEAVAGSRWRLGVLLLGGLGDGTYEADGVC